MLRFKDWGSKEISYQYFLAEELKVIYRSIFHIISIQFDT